MMKSDLDTEVSFRPLTDGLGFHPFSDGLPYAPLGKKVAPRPDASVRARLALGASLGTGSGATAAGAPQAVLPARPALRVQVPVVQAHSTQAAQTHGTPQRTTPAKAAVSKTIPEKETEMPEVRQDYGAIYLLKRVTAYLVDTAVNISICAATLGALFWKESSGSDLFTNPSAILVAAIFLCVFNWALITAQELAFGTSIGKRVFGLVLRGSTSAVFLRAFFFLPSLGLGGLGVLAAAIDPRNRGWHDRIAGLQPIEIARL